MSRRDSSRFAAGLPRIEVVGKRRATTTDVYHRVLAMSAPRFALLIALQFLAINALFAVLYRLQPGSIAQSRSLADAFFFSIETMATIGYGVMYPSTTYANVLMTIEALLGLVGFAVVAGVTFARFSRPTARVLFCRRAVIGTRDGVPFLMFRLANERHDQIVETQLHVTMMMTETTAEGDVMRRLVDLPLVRERSPTFNLTWTAMHRMDETSPFRGAGALDRLRRANAELYLTVLGTDELLSQTVHARHIYRLDDIVIGARFADVLTMLPDGTRRIDYTHFDDVVPMPMSPSIVF